MTSGWSSFNPEQQDRAARMFDALSTIDTISDAMESDRPRRIGFSDLFAFATDPDSIMRPELAEALSHDTALEEDLLRLLDRTAAYRFPKVAAASSGPLSLRKLSYGVWATTRRWAEGKGTQQTPQYMPAGRGAAPASADEELVVLETTQGRIVIRLYEGDAPLHVANFKKLAREGFYEGDARSFHRYEKGFVIQGGDPWGLDPARAGKGGPGYTVPEEIKRKHVRGAVAAARQGDSTNPERRSSGSQFYICLGRPFHLNGKYTVFGQVIEGMGAVDKLRVGDEMTKTSVIPASEHKPDK